MTVEKEWFLYMILCRDQTIYTGITVNVEKRFRAHCAGKGAKYTRGRGPLQLVYQESCGSHTDALRREYAIKQLSRFEKETMILNYSSGQGANAL